MKLENLRCWAEVNLDGFANNIRVIKNHIGDKKFIAVIKANGYGHGATALARVASAEGVDGFAVACVNEAISLRKEGITEPIIVLSFFGEGNADNIIKYNLIPVVHDINFAKIISEKAVKSDTVVKIHIKLNTGMTRLGFDAMKKEETVNAIKYIASLPNIEIDGIFSHFADADNEDMTYTRTQYKFYDEIIEAIEKEGVIIPNKHICNSAALIANKEMALSGVRPGIILYGYYPEKYLENILPGIKPFMEIKSVITQIREIEEETTVSYGRTYKADKKRKTAIIPIGYADGYSRLLSNKFHILISGKKAKILGRVCMDQMIVDITDIENVKVGDIVTVIGKNGDLEITADDIAKVIGTISYEVLCNVGMRVPRVYLKDGKIDSIVNYLE